KLLELGDSFGVPEPGERIRIACRLSQQELGRLVGATREMTNKCMREWAKSRWIRYTRGSLTILSAGRLSRVAEGQARRKAAKRPGPPANGGPLALDEALRAG